MQQVWLLQIRIKMVFGQPVYNTQQRRAALQQFKDYIDELNRKKNLPAWDVTIKKEREKVSKVRRRRIKRNNLPIKLRKCRRMRIRRRRHIKQVFYTMFAAILSDLKRKEKQRKRFLPSVKRK